MDNTGFPSLKQRSFGSSKDLFAQWKQSVAVGTEPLESSGVNSLYIHIPFCFHKCHYCDFYSIVDRSDRQEAFVDRMVQELRSQSKAVHATNTPALRTIFMGGGTPTLLAPHLLNKLLVAVSDAFTIEPDIEWTIESNPETFTDQICDVLAASGVNRISMGAQTFHPSHLKALERHHNPESVPIAIDRAKNAGFDRLSLDLIYGIPDQTLDQWADDLNQALSLPIDHISAYALTYEPNTAMTARLKRGEFVPAPDELEVRMYNHTLSEIQKHGFERYEVSNHAKPGSECRHNLAYWQGENWLAVGPSASGHLDGYRWKNTPKLDQYLKSSDEGFAPICDFEAPDPRRMLMDWMMMGIRVREGLDKTELLTHASQIKCDEQISKVMDQCIDQGWVQDCSSHWKLTDQGYHFADRVARDLIGALIKD